MTRLSALGAVIVVAALSSPEHVGAARSEDARKAAPPAAPPSVAIASADACGAALHTASASPVMEKKDANLLHAAVGAAIRSDASCAARVKEWLSVNACTQAHGVVSSAAFGTKEWPTAWTSELVNRALERDAAGEASCIQTTLPSVEQSVRVDPALATALERATQNADPDTRDAGWLLLGTAERRARATGEAELASAIDARIGTELHRRTTRKGEDADVLLESAGNAGCTSCVADVERAQSSNDPVTRRIAGGALRFVAEPGVTARTCGVLRSDASSKVRAHAAWALGWSHVDAETRIACLREAAENDASDEVRADAVRAIEQLINETTTMEDEGA